MSHTSKGASKSRPTNPIVWGTAGIVVGAVSAGMATWTLLAGNLTQIGNLTDVLFGFLFPLMTGIAFSTVFLFPIVWFFLKKFVVQTNASLEEVVSSTSAATKAIADGDPQSAIFHSEQAVRDVAAWYAPIAARQWVVQTTLALLVTFGGLVGAGLLLRQTILLGQQNEKLDAQMRLMELQTLAARSDQTRQLYRDYVSLTNVQATLQASLDIYEQAKNQTINIEGRAARRNEEPPPSIEGMVVVRDYLLNLCTTPSISSRNGQNWNREACASTPAWTSLDGLRTLDFEKFEYAGEILGILYYLQSISVRQRDTLNPPRGAGEREAETYLPDVLRSSAEICRVNPESLRETLNLAVRIRMLEASAQQLGWLFQFGFPVNRASQEREEWLNSQIESASTEFGLAISDSIHRAFGQRAEYSINNVARAISNDLNDLNNRIRLFLSSCDLVRNTHEDLLSRLDPTRSPLAATHR